MQSKNKNQQNALPEQQNVQALPTPPLAELSDQNGGVAAELGAAPCSASFSSENWPLKSYGKPKLSFLEDDSKKNLQDWLLYFERHMVIVDRG